MAFGCSLPPRRACDTATPQSSAKRMDSVVGQLRVEYKEEDMGTYLSCWETEVKGADALIQHES